jgi:hypothetical protein
MRVRVQEEQEREQERQFELELGLELGRVKQQVPFRVLSPGGRILYEPRPVLRSPPPARAPEPYKLAPQMAGTGRSQRKSSFAIIAETQHLGPPSRPSSGRLSPFRGRGFKGPPPRSTLANGRQSPTEDSSRRPARPRAAPPGTCLSYLTAAPRHPSPVVQSLPSPMSHCHAAPCHVPIPLHALKLTLLAGSPSRRVNSPKRSLIPRAEPSRGLSSSHGLSPKFGRRAANHRYTSSIGNSETNHRRPSQRELKRRKEHLLSSPSAVNNKSPPDKVFFLFFFFFLRPREPALLAYSSNFSEPSGPILVPLHLNPLYFRPRRLTFLPFFQI